MRPIPPEIWSFAIGLGHVQAAIAETHNMHATIAAKLMEQKIERFLENTRKGKRK